MSTKRDIEGLNLEAGNKELGGIAQGREGTGLARVCTLLDMAAEAQPCPACKHDIRIFGEFSKPVLGAGKTTTESIYCFGNKLGAWRPLQVWS